MTLPAIYEQLVEAGVSGFDGGWIPIAFKFLEQVTDDDDNDCLGSLDYDAGICYLKSTVSNAVAIETLTHEIFHWILTNCGLDDEDNDKVFPVKNEELATKVSRSFLLFKRLNPKLCEILFKW